MTGGIFKIIFVILILGIILGGALLMTQDPNNDCPTGCLHYFRMK